MAAACGAKHPPPVRAQGPPPSIERVDAAGAPSLDDLLAPVQLSVQRVEPGGLRWDPAPKAGSAARLYSAPAPAGTTHVRLSGRFTGAGTLRVCTINKSGPPTPVDHAQLHWTGFPETCLLAMPWHSDDQGTAFLASGELRSADDVQVEFLRRDPAAVLPRSMAWAALGGEYRPAWGVFPGHGLRATWEHFPSGTLQLAVGLPQDAAPTSTGACNLRLQAGALSESRRVELGPARERWITVAFDLPADQPGPLSLTCELAAGPGQLSGFLISEPVLRLPQQGAPRTVLLVTSDTHRADYVGYARDDFRLMTPALDALAARGTVFKDCVATTNITNPSHVAIFTGTHPRDTGIVDNRTPLSEDAPTLAEAFRSAGFMTFAAVSASHLLPSRSGLGQGFERVAGPRFGEGTSFDSIARLLEWLPEADGRDLFVWLHVFDAHAPYEPPEPYDTQYWDEHVDPRDPTLPKPSADIPWAKDVRDLRYLEALYRGEVTWLDERLRTAFEHPRLATGLIAFTGDHGEHLGVDDGWFDHLGLSPDTLRVPLLLAGPGVPVGGRVMRPVQNMDLARTLLDLAGLSDVALPGSDLLSQVKPEPRFALDRRGETASIEEGRYLLVLYLRERAIGQPAIRRPIHAVELFDVEADPGASVDLLVAEGAGEAARDEARAMAAKLRGRLVEWLRAARTSRWDKQGVGLGESEVSELSALGYAAGETAGAAAGAWFPESCGCERCGVWAGVGGR